MPSVKAIETVANHFSCTNEIAEKFLKDECGCYARVGEERLWISGDLINSLLQELVTEIECLEES